MVTFAWWSHVMEPLSALPGLYEGNKHVNGTELWCVSCFRPKQTVDLTSVIDKIDWNIFLVLIAQNIMLDFNG